MKTSAKTLEQGCQSLFTPWATYEVSHLLVSTSPGRWLLVDIGHQKGAATKTLLLLWSLDCSDPLQFIQKMLQTVANYLSSVSQTMKSGSSEVPV